MEKYTINGKEIEVLGIEASTLDMLEACESEEIEWKPGKSEYAVMLTIATVSLMVALDATILVPVLPQLAVDLGGTTSDAFWAGTSYLLTCAVFQPFIAALSDVFGRREMFLVSIFLFTLGTLLCAPIADTFAVLFAGRSLQGIGGGGIMTMGQMIYSDIVPLRQRPKYFAIVLGSWALGSVLGPLAGGLFAQHLSWRWCFYVNFPFCLFGFIFVPIFVKLTTEKSSLLAKLRRVDWLGAFLFIGSMTSFLIGLSWAGIQFDWISVQTLAPMGVGVLGLIVTIVWERFGAVEPLLRPSLFYSPSALAAYAGAWCQGFLLFCALYYIPFYFMSVRFTSPTDAGINIFPVTCLLLPGSIVVSFLTSRLGRFRWAIWSGWMITAAGCGLLLLLDEDTSTPVWAAILAIFGVGNGMVLTSVNVGIQAISHVEDCGRAASMYAFMRTLGMTIGVAVGGTVFQNVMSAKLHELQIPHSDDIAHNAEAFAFTLAKLSPTDPERIGALQAYIKGFHGVFWAMTATACLAFLLSLIIRRHSMDKILESKFTLSGGKGAAIREKVDAVEAHIDRISRRFSSHVDLAAKRASAMFLSPQAGLRSSTHLRVPERDDLVPLRPTTSHSAKSAPLYRTVPIPTSLRPRSAVTISAIAVEQAPAVAYYVAPGGRRVPVDISAKKMAVEPIPPMPEIPSMMFYIPGTLTKDEAAAYMKESMVR